MRFIFSRLRFLAYLQKGLSSRQLRRLAMLDLLRRAAASKEIPAQSANALIALAQLVPSAVLQRLGGHRDGLLNTEAAERLERIGLNEVDQEKPISWREHLWLCYRNPFNLLLTVLATISWLTGDVEATIIITTMVVLSTMLRFVQEKRSNNAAERLKAMVSNTATVQRRIIDPDVPDAPATIERIELPIKQLVPGDVILLSAGDMIPADLRLLSAKDLFVSQAALTGESLPVEKYVEQRHPDITNPLELDNLCFMGTNVVSGTASAIVLTTGRQTCFGALAERVTAERPEVTAFQAGVNKVSWLLIRFMFVMAPLVLLINGFTKGDWLDAALFALSIAVGLTPEMLPMIVTATLAKGAVLLSRKQVIVKRLDAIQNFGAMDILCTDKTGTLTQDKIVLERHTDVFGNVSDEVLHLAWLNSYHQTGLKNLLDVAVLEYFTNGQSHNPGIQHHRKIDEIPFDFVRRRMSVVVETVRHSHLLICKGAVDEILAACSHVRHGDTVEPLTKALLHRVRDVTTGLNQDGLRVVAVAIRELPAERDEYSVNDENGLTLIGYIAFLDPPKDSTEPALKALKASGIAVKVLTGDNELVTLRVCKAARLPVEGVLLGHQIETMDDTELADAATNVTVFAKLSPLQKERLVRALRNKGHVVGFMGDGINDAPALRAADIGISVDSAVDIAKEAADIILLEKSLMVLEQGVIEGRKTFVNMLKYIKMTASSNFGNVFSVLIASAFIPFLPMLPLHLLVQNLLYDISQTTIPFDHVDEELLAQPQKWNPNDLSRFMIFFGPISSVFDILTYLLMWHVFGANNPAHQTLFQSGWFVEGLLSQTLIVHMIRTRKIPFIQSRAAWPLMTMTVFIVAAGIFLPMGPLAPYFKLQALPLSYFPWLIVILLGYMVLTQTMKGLYARRYGWQ